MNSASVESTTDRRAAMRSKCSSDSPTIDTGRRIPFPFKPYPVQQQLMDEILSLLISAKESIDPQQQSMAQISRVLNSTTEAELSENSSTHRQHRASVGIFESPTGSGKSLSLLSAILYFLLDFDESNDQLKQQSNAANEIQPQIQSGNSTSHSSAPSWVTDFARESAKKEKAEAIEALRLVKERIAKFDKFTDKSSNSRNSNDSPTQETDENSFVLQRRNRNQVGKVSKLKRRNQILTDEDDEKRENESSKSNRSEKNEDSDSDLIADYDDFAASKQQNPNESSSSMPEWQRLLAAEQQLNESESAGEMTQTQRIESMLQRHHQQTQAKSNSSFSEFTASQCTLPVQRPQLIYTSRTHSQLSQLVDELQKTEFASRVSVVALASRQQLCVHTGVRQQFGHSSQRLNDACAQMQESSGKKHPLISKRLKSVVDLSRSCPYLDATSQALMRDMIIARAPQQYDIERCFELGERLSACSYYAARAATRFAHLITLPYQTLLHASTRAATGVDIRDAIIVVDEAHNLIESMNEMHSVSLNFHQLSECEAQLKRYSTKYEKRFRKSTKHQLQQLQIAIQACIQYMEQQQKQQSMSSSNSSNQKILSLNSFVAAAELHSVNLYTICDFIQRTELAKKLNGFVTKYNSNESESNVAIHSKVTSVRANLNLLLTVEAFLQSLNHSNSDGRILIDLQPTHQSLKSMKDDTNSISKSSQHSAMLRHQREMKSNSLTAAAIRVAPTSSLKFVLLNPSAAFSSLLREARCVILIGGTMQPFHHITQQLQLDEVSDITAESNSLTSTDSSSTAAAAVAAPVLFSCDHVIDPSHVLCVTLSTGPSARIPFQLKFTNRSDESLHTEIGRTVANLVNVLTPTNAGVVLFFTSYAMERTIVETWKKRPENASNSLFDQLNKRKPIFRELSNEAKAAANSAADPDSSTTSVESVLQQYSAAIRAPNSRGALLTCVMGGKLSEGINFSDELARLVVVVGMPFANPNDPLLKEKMRHLDERAAKLKQVKSISSENKLTSTVSNGSAYYEALCMRSVNQSIGRSIRHINDYAAIVLLDCRYSKPDIVAQLPHWIQRRTQHAQTFGQAFGEIRAFFQHQQSKRSQTEANASQAQPN